MTSFDRFEELQDEKIRNLFSLVENVVKGETDTSNLPGVVGEVVDEFLPILRARRSLNNKKTELSPDQIEDMTVTILSRVYKLLDYIFNCV